MLNWPGASAKHHEVLNYYPQIDYIDYVFMINIAMLII